MNSDKLGLTLFDILGYLLPGYILVSCGSVIEATFLGSSLLSFSAIGNSIFFFTIVAYYGGHLCHIVSSLIKDRFFRHIGQEYRQNSSLYKRFRDAVIDTYNLNTKDKLDSLDLYLLADSYIIASGALDERNSLLAREGFYKAGTSAFGFLSITVFSSIFVGGTRLQIEPGVVQLLGITPTIVFVLLSLIMFLLFANRFVFYNRMKLQNTYNLFLAIRKKEEMKN